MSTIEQLFSRAAVDILVPTAPFSLADAARAHGRGYAPWLERVGGDGRGVVFYDERLPLLLSLKLPSSSALSLPDADTDTADTDTSDSPAPPALALALLARTQLSLEASYISSVPFPGTPLTPGPMASAVALGPPSARPTSASMPGPGPGPGRTASLRPGQAVLPPSMHPPTTPFPTPGTAGGDRKYNRAEGVVMGTFVWGEDADEREAKEEAGVGAGERFALVWNERERCWVALFRMDITIAYLRTRSPDPLLCLTCSATLRDKPLPATPARAPLMALLAAANVGLNITPELPQTPFTAASAASAASTMNSEMEEDEDDDYVARFEEVNLLEGLVGPSYSSLSSGSSSEDRLMLPSTRLSQTLRRELFSLPTLASPPSSAVTTSAGTATPAPTPLTAHTRAKSVPAIMRKAFRKVLPVVSGIKVRMRASFLPRTGLADETGDEAEGDGDGDGESDGKRCMLCVEVEHAGERAYGFELERIDVSVSGDYTRTSLVGWDAPVDKDQDQDDGHGHGIFPLRLGAADQYNLLYDVAFTNWAASASASAAGTAAQQQQQQARRASGRLSQRASQRSVSIVVHGRPFLPAASGASTPTSADPTLGAHPKANSKPEYQYVAASFPSTWNTTIDISPILTQTDAESVGAASRDPGEQAALPTPASPVRFSLPGSHN